MPSWLYLNVQGEGENAERGIVSSLLYPYPLIRFLSTQIWIDGRMIDGRLALLRDELENTIFPLPKVRFRCAIVGLLMRGFESYEFDSKIPSRTRSRYGIVCTLKIALIESFALAPTKSSLGLPNVETLKSPMAPVGLIKDAFRSCQ